MAYEVTTDVAGAAFSDALPRFDEFEVLPAAGALGAEISAVDLSKPLNDAAFAELRSAYHFFGVTFFRDQQITPK
jgi:taurine dioxygenase